MSVEECNSRIESRAEVVYYLQNLKYALGHGAKITFQSDRNIEKTRDPKYKNSNTIASLFPNENPADVLRRELKLLTVEEYIQTVKDIRFPNRSEMREFGRVYNGTDDVYIKIRVELLGDYAGHTVFVMSFHYAMRPLTPDNFPYKTSALK